MKTPRDPAHSAALKETFDQTLAIYDAALGPDAFRPDMITAEQLAAVTPEARRAWAYMLLVVEASPLYTWDPDRPSTCGWCVRAAGNDKAAYEAAEVFETNDAHREHVLQCKHMPLVAEVERLRARIADLEAGRAIDDREYARMRAVFDAAKAWRMSPRTQNSWICEGDPDYPLREAVDAALAGEAKKE